MAKTFLTNINLKGNQLLNAVIHSASSAPSALAAGQLYFNTGDSIFYFSTGTGTGNWSPVGVQYIESVDTNFSVTDKTLSLATDVTLTGALYVGGTTNHGLDVDGNGNTELGSTTGIALSANNDINLTTTGGDIVFSADGDVYKGSVTPDNRLATFGDITGDLTGYVTETAIQTLTNKTIDGGNNTLQNIPNSSLTNSKVTINGYDVNLGSSVTLYTDDISESVSPNNVYFTNTRARNAISGSSGISYNSSTGAITANYTDIESQLTIDGYIKSTEQYIQSVGVNLSVTGTELDLGDKVVITDAAQTLSNKTIGDKLNFTGYTSPLDGYIWSNTDNGDIELWSEYNIQLSPSGIVNIGDGYGELHLQKTEYWRNGTEQGVIAAQSDNSLRLTATAGDFDIESNNGDINLTANNNVSIQTSNGDIVLNADGNSYINSVSDGNRIAKISDIHASTAGLSVKNSVAVASTGANISLTGTYTTSFKIDNYPLETGDRVLLKDQSDATANGIYVVTITDASHYSLSRAEDQLTPAEGDFTFVSDGDTWSKTGWIVNDIDAGVVLWTQFSAAGEYTQGAGITISGNEISVDYTAVETQLVSDNFAKTSDIPSSSTIASDITASSTYISDNAGIIDVNISALESQLVTDDFAKNADYSTVTRKYSSSITGNNIDSTFSFTHALATRDVMVRIYQTSAGSDQYNDIEVDVKRTSTNAISVSFASAPATGETYNVVVIG